MMGMMTLVRVLPEDQYNEIQRRKNQNIPEEQPRHDHTHAHPNS
jgi:hypothetical protein